MSRGIADSGCPGTSVMVVQGWVGDDDSAVDANDDALCVNDGHPLAWPVTRVLLAATAVAVGR
ncbi:MULTISPECIES: hypothetical protein [Mycolicibacterium]|jgi:hypothetical protein|nr:MULTISPECIES: hypothetical protein [Mycolicibacterium]MCV7183798.1 hypothetical protein [Mycolicibacterium murale]